MYKQQNKKLNQETKHQGINYYGKTCRNEEEMVKKRK